MRPDTSEFSITLKPGNKFEQIVQRPFHISQASLKNLKEGVTFVYFETEEDEFLVCRLCSFVSAEALDINFQPRNKIVFKTYGNGTVNLTCQNDNEKKLWDTWDPITKGSDLVHKLFRDFYLVHLIRTTNTNLEFFVYLLFQLFYKTKCF